MLKMLWSLYFCRHQWELSRVFNGSDIALNGNNNCQYWCSKCGLYEYRHEKMLIGKFFDGATEKTLVAPPAIVSVGVDANEERVLVSVHLKQGERTTVLYQERHSAKAKTIGMIEVPAGLLTPVVDDFTEAPTLFPFPRNNAQTPDRTQ